MTEPRGETSRLTPLRARETEDSRGNPGGGWAKGRSSQKSVEAATPEFS